ncbi:MAG: alpha/beta hydrolase [Inquilinus sp.]|nr:alpha/beta hydrolase [Inquilinus sp.]
MGEMADLYTLTTSRGASIAFSRSRPATGQPAALPGVVFCGGFRSDMSGTKASFLDDVCRRRSQPYLRFDYSGHGRSDGRFEDGTIGGWLADTLAVLDGATDGPQILVGSSMGGWIATLAALARPERVAGLVCVAAAPDFTEELIWDRLDETARARLRADGVIHRPSDYADAPDPIALALIEEGRRHLILGGPVDLAIPVRLIHGMADADVPWRQSLRFAERIAGPDVRLTLVKDGDHRLSRDADLALLAAAVAEVSAAGLSASAGGGGGGTG